jgi:phytoene/squalene synthetase
VRIADEIVDTYTGSDKEEQLNALEKETYDAIERRYSTNPIVHAFARTAQEFSIDETLIKPFFDSMRMDIHPQEYDDTLYAEYIHGSAEVVGLMCLRVFTLGDHEMYTELTPGAVALGSAYQKVNFLRDITDDRARLGRTYFPGVKYDSFSNADKRAIVESITADFDVAREAIGHLPSTSRVAVASSYVIYRRLLDKLSSANIEDIKTTRIRLSGYEKAWYVLRTVLSGGKV